MPNHQKHRGQHSSDQDLFARKQIPVLRKALREYAFLLSREYPENASLKLVGDTYKLRQRQRKALMRVACSDQARWRRQRKELEASDLSQGLVQIDAYNLLITIESYLSDGIILYCRDGAYRDMASVHGTYHRVEETIPALKLIGKALKELNVRAVEWYLDAPVSNSGRLRSLMMELAREENWAWDIQLVPNPDKVLSHSGEIVITSDSAILDQASCWFNMNEAILMGYSRKANLRNFV